MSETVLLPAEASKWIAENSEDVTICDDEIKKTAQLILECAKGKELETKRWKQHTLNPKVADEAAVDWIFLVDILNFSFWSDDETKQYLVRYNNQDWTGYWSLCAAVNRAIDEGIPITDPKYYAQITKEQLQHVLRSDSAYDIPMSDQRMQVLHEAGKKLLQDYGGSYVNVIKQCDHSAQKLLLLSVRQFDSLRDEGVFKGKRVAFYKRAQILIADIWACFEGKGLGKFTDIDVITMFADYRIPQALVWFGALKYSDRLLELLNRNHIFHSGERMEIEMRGCSIHAVQLVVEEAKRLTSCDATGSADAPINAIVVDFYLWDYRRAHAKETVSVPFHKIRCIYY